MAKVLEVPSMPLVPLCKQHEMYLTSRLGLKRKILGAFYLFVYEEQHMKKRTQNDLLINNHIIRMAWPYDEGRDSSGKKKDPSTTTNYEPDQRTLHKG